MIRELHLRDAGVPGNLDLTFTERLNLVTGDNGLGKTFVLDSLWWSLTRTWRAEQATPAPGVNKPSISATFDGAKGPSTFTAEFQRERGNWVPNKGQPAKPGLVIYVGVDGSFAVWDPQRNHARERANVEQQDFPPAFRFSPNEIWNGLKLDDGRVLCRGLIEDWVSWQSEQLPEFKTLEKVLARLGEPGKPLEVGKPARFDLLDSRRYPTLNLSYGTIPLVHASSGLRRITALAYLLVWSWYEHRETARLAGVGPTDSIVFLVDELEAHLHPKWQRTILPSLIAVAKDLDAEAKVQLIVTTHSPWLPISVEAIASDADSIFEFDLDDTTTPASVKLERKSITIKGSVEDWNESSTFDMHSSRSTEAEAAINAAAALLDLESVPNSGQIETVEQQLSAALSDTDAFWARWEWWKESIG